MAALTLHHLEQSRSERILWLLEELALDYEIVRYPRVAGRAPQSLHAVHPLGRAPILTHGDRAVVESGAMVEYVLDQFGDGRLRPEAGTDAYERYRLFLHFAEGSMMAPLLVKLLMSTLAKKLPLLGKMVAKKIDGLYTDPQIASQMDFLEAELDGRDWFAGELSGADIMMSYPMQGAFIRAADGARYPRCRAYVDRFEARPAYQRAMKKIA